MNILIFLFVFFLKPNGFYQYEPGWLLIIKLKLEIVASKNRRRICSNIAVKNNNLEISGILLGNMQLKYSP